MFPVADSWGAFREFNANHEPGGSSKGGEFASASSGFTTWFKGSKAVDKSGQPLRLYHGTPAGVNFDTFKLPRTGNQGLWFTAYPPMANLYANVEPTPGATAGPRLIPVYLNVKNPWRPESMGEFASTSTKKLQALGYDGIAMHDNNIWIAFKPSQVKGAFNQTFKHPTKFTEATDVPRT